MLFRCIYCQFLSQNAILWYALLDFTSSYCDRKWVSDSWDHYRKLVESEVAPLAGVSRISGYYVFKDVPEQVETSTNMPYHIIQLQLCIYIQSNVWKIY